MADVHVHRMNDDGLVGPKVADYQWSSGWTMARVFKSGRDKFLFLLKQRTGDVHIHQISPDGTVGKKIADYKWSTGWKQVAFYRIERQTYLFLLKSDADDDKVPIHIHSMNPDGTVGPLIHEYRWSKGWNRVRTMKVRGKRYLFLLKTKQGLVHIHSIEKNGSVGPKIVGYGWSEGWTSVQAFTIGDDPYLFLMKKKSDKEKVPIHIHSITPNATVGDIVHRYGWSKGWTHNQFYRIHGKLFLFLLKSKSGKVHIHEIDSDGAVGRLVQSYDWSSGWSQAQFYKMGNDVYMFLLKTE